MRLIGTVVHLVVGVAVIANTLVLTGIVKKT